jgi:hypothetical protein
VNRVSQLPPDIWRRVRRLYGVTPPHHHHIRALCVWLFQVFEDYLSGKDLGRVMQTCITLKTIVTPLIKDAADYWKMRVTDVSQSM